jgi:hypothetical protein
MFIIPALRKWKQENHDPELHSRLEASQGYTVRSCPQKQKEKIQALVLIPVIQLFRRVLV